MDVKGIVVSQFLIQVYLDVTKPVIMSTSDERDASSDEESPDSRRIEGAPAERSVSLNQGHYDESGEESEVGGGGFVGVRVEGRQSPDDDRQDERAEDELDEYFHPEVRIQ